MAQFYTEYQSIENLAPLVGEISSNIFLILKKRQKTKEREFYILIEKNLGGLKRADSSN